MVEREDLKEIINEIEKDFSFLKGKILALLIFGSWAKGKKGRDIDICIVTPKKEPRKILKEVFQRVNVNAKNYDIHVFETLPLYVKASIIENHIIIFGDPFGLGEYFYTYRKIWKDQKHRQKLSKEEILRILSK